MTGVRGQQKDNSTFNQKVILRRQMLKLIPDPVVMETHGGAGKIYEACYSELKTGIVFEKDDQKVSVLAKQRPGWSVYQADSAAVVGLGAGAHLPVNVLDCDPYGDPWPVIEAFFSSDRPRSETMAVVVNDGLRHNVCRGKSWSVPTLQKMVAKVGNNLYPLYLEVCQELMIEKAGQAGYHLTRWAGYYTGYNGLMTHYLAILERGNL